MSACIDSISTHPIASQDYPRLEEFGRLGKRLILHLDVNKTLLAKDPAGGKPEVSMVIQELLAEKYTALWSEELRKPISYSDYVNQVLYPGDKSDPVVRAARFEKLHNFVRDYADSPFTMGLKAEFANLIDCLEGREIFDSFFTAVDGLCKLRVSSTVVLRTFGSDLKDVKKSIQVQLPAVSFVDGRYSKGVLECGGCSHSSVEDQIECFVAHAWLAIQDEFAYWKDGGRTAKYGKPFPVDLSNLSVHGVFFDDNIDSDEIIGPKGPDGDLDPDILKDKGLLVAVDTIEAIRNPEYFLQCIESSLKLA